MTLRADSADSGKRLDAFLHGALPEFSRSRLQSWIKSGRVLVDGQGARASYILRGGESISVTPAELPPLKAAPEELPLRVLYEDSDVVAVDKPAGMVVHAGAGHANGTLVNALLHHFGPLSSVNGDLRPGIVHRLDRETSGVLVAARTDRAHQSLAAQFHDRQVEKIYLALVHGRMKKPQGRITSPISRDPVRRTRMTAKLATGRAALTEYRLIEQFEKLSYLEVRIGTGRTHQIRAHLASLGHPVAGDRLYGAPAAIAGLPTLGRFFLHARRLTFRSPSESNPITVESPLPPELASFLEALRMKRG
ncbi:MAG: RluA family pseudouridine synthase [Acidobacteriaceae bacterium]|nr:RluA family pseudouridine synthase [Acidobacteriaceae bacterium]